MTESSSKPTPKSAAVYLRVSTPASQKKKKTNHSEESDPRQNPDNQKAPLLSLIKSRGWKLHHIYLDRETGSSSTRTAFLQLMADAKAKKFDAVVFWSLDRFSREGVLPTLLYLDELKSQGIDWVSLQEPYLDSLGPFKDAIVGLIASVAQMERQRLSERVKAGIARRKAEGRSVGRARIEISRDDLQKMVNDGWSNRRVASVLKVSLRTIKNRIREFSIKKENT